MIPGVYKDWVLTGDKDHAVKAVHKDYNEKNGLMLICGSIDKAKIEIDEREMLEWD